MRRLIIFCLLFLLLVSTIRLQHAYAQQPTATPVLSSSPAVTTTATPAVNPAAAPAVQPAAPVSTGPAQVEEITFAELEVPNIELLAPVDQYSFEFQVPYRWQINPNASYIQVNYRLQTTNNTGPTPVPGQTSADQVGVYYNDELISYFVPRDGMDNSVQIPIPPEVLNQPGQSDNHRLRFLYVSGECNVVGDRSQLFIHNSSLIHFDYTLLPLDIDLAQFPQPLIQNLFQPETILLVIPDNYSDSDLTAAASVAAALGSYTYNSANLELVTASQATPELFADAGAIIIGTPETNRLLSDLYQNNNLPTTLNADGSAILSPDGQPIEPRDGVIQEIISPYSPEHPLLIVTGLTDEAVITAARALSALSPRYGFVGDLAVVEEFQNLTSTAPDEVDTFTLADFGFSDVTFYGMDTHSSSLRFFIPFNWELQDTSTLNLSYIHAASLNPTGSGITVNLNGKPVGSVPIETNTLGERTAEIQLAKNDLKPGAFNRLTFDITVDVPLPDCAIPDPDTIWLRINESSQMHLPHIEKTEATVTPSLQDAFSRLITRQDMSNILFALPEQPTPDELQGVLDSAMWLGNFSGGPGFAPLVSRTETITTLAQTETPYHVIAFGRPTANPLIAQLNDSLPQPFVPGEDNLQQTVGNIVYRLPAQFEIGLLQALNTPWNPATSILVATGTSDTSVAQAIQTLTSQDTYYLLSHDLAFINGDNVETIDSTQYVRGAMIPGVEAVSPGEGEVVMEEITSTISIATPSAPTATPAPARNYTAPEQPAPSLLVVFGLVGAGLLVVFLGGFFAWRNTRKQAALHDQSTPADYDD